MPIDSVIHTNQYSLDRVLQTGLPVLLVFWRQDAALDGQTDAALDQLAKRYAGRGLIAKVDAAAEPGLVKRFAVAALPSIVVTKGGKTEATLSGRVSAADLGAWLAYLVEGGPRPAAASGPGAAAQPHANGHFGAQSGAQGGASAPITLTDGNFQQVISGPGPVLVDFWAAWCGPCRVVAPELEQMASAHAGRVVVLKVDTDALPDVAGRYAIRAIPTFLRFDRGKETKRSGGAQSAAALAAALGLGRAAA